MSIKMKCWHYFLRFFFFFCLLEYGVWKTSLPFLCHSGGFLSKPILVLRTHMEMFPFLSKFLSLFNTRNECQNQLLSSKAQSPVPGPSSTSGHNDCASNLLIFVHWSQILANSTKTASKSEIRCVLLHLEFCYCSCGSLQ